MHERRRPIAKLLLVAVIVGVIGGGSVFVPSSASAYHTYDTRLLDSTAYSLHRRRFRLGLLKLSYGVFDFFQVSTYTAPWLLGVAFETVAPNIELKSTFYDRKRLALSASLGYVTGTLEQVVDVPESRVRYHLIPVSLASSVRINSWVSTHLGGTFSVTEGDANAGLGTSDIDGSAYIDLLQLWGMVEWRLSRVVAFTFTVRWVPWVSDTIVRGRVIGEQGNPDIDLQIQLEFIDLTNAFAVIPGFVFSWKRANIRMGVGYGDLFTNFVGFPFAVPRGLLNGVSLELDVFVRF